MEFIIFRMSYILAGNILESSFVLDVDQFNIVACKQGDFDTLSNVLKNKRI